MTGLEFSRALKYGPYVEPGGYPRFLVMTDGGCLCFACAEAERARIRHAAMTKNTSRGGWCPVGFDVNWESEIWCDNCGEAIASAYPPVSDE